MRGSVGLVRGADQEIGARERRGAEPYARIIRRYSNRKLYDPSSSQYITLPQLTRMLRRGEVFRIIDNTTKEDKTHVTLASILTKELSQAPTGFPLAMLRALLRGDSSPPSSGVTGLERGGGGSWPLAETVPTTEEDEMNDTPKARRGTHSESGEWQLGEAVGASPAGGSLEELQGQVRRLDERLTALERQLSPTKNGKLANRARPNRTE